ncbi:hypothetical protein [Paracoccus alkenifer]|uniref:hypothetical protein n=1 Tax=Paracoccus alkenifer TaxID=65735 RepID=UPI00115FF368|nr:hypothetical protein [Paracoccus alkenifer]
MGDRHPNDLLYPPALAAPRFLGQVLKKQHIHRALEADVHLVDPTLSHRVQSNPLEAKALVDMGDVLLIAGDPVECLGKD